MVNHFRFLKFLTVSLAAVTYASAVDYTRPLVWTLEVDPAFKDDYRVQNGYLPVTRFGADPAGGRDSTKAIQACIDQAFASHLACYFPTGTYLVSGQLRCIQPARTMTDVHVLIGEVKAGRRPVIKLKDRALTEEPTAVVLLQAQEEGKENVPAAYNMLFRGIDFDLGEGNSGAIGVQMHGAQGCAIQDTKIIGRGFYAGIKHLAGSGACYGNIEVDGGEYGVDASQDIAKDPVIAGLVLRNQRVAAFLFDPYTALTVVGFEFEAVRGPLITLRRREQNCTGHLGLIDGIIKLSDPTGPALLNLDRSIYLKDVYVNNAKVVVENAKGALLAGTLGGWTRVNEYSFFDQRDSRLVDGQLGGAGIVVNDVMRDFAGSVPADCVARNIWDESNFPSIEKPDSVVNASDCGADRHRHADATAAIQRAIDQADREGKAVFLPKGDYRVSGTLRLHPGTRLVGVSRSLSVLYADNSWRAATDTPMMASAADASATTLIAFFSLNLNDDGRSRLYWLNWQAGRRSMVREVWFEKDFHSVPYAQKYIYITGTGGGRWYGLFTRRRGGTGTRLPDFRYLVVDGTTEPLHFYAYCPEYAQSDCLAEFDHVENVFVYGLKSETDLTLTKNATPPLWVRDSKNILICGYTGIAEADRGRGLIELKGHNSDIVIANMGRWRKSAAPGGTWYYVRDEESGQGILESFVPDPKESERNVASIFKKGNVTLVHADGQASK